MEKMETKMELTWKLGSYGFKVARFGVPGLGIRPSKGTGCRGSGGMP